MRLIELQGRLEQRILMTSIGATLAVALVGVVFGVLSHSFAILFDGVYALIDASMSVLALLVTRLILADAISHGKEEGRSAKYQFGFWHLEPMVLALNGTLLTLAALYALFNAVMSLLDGGRELAFDWAIVYAAVVVVICFAMAFYEYHQNRRIRSDFVALDAKGWLMSGAITLALLIAFSIGAALEGTAYAHLQPYIDPAVLIVVCLVVIPMPLGNLAQAIRDIFLVAPESLDEHVQGVVDQAAARHGFIDSTTYVAKVGRSVLIEIHLIAPEGYPISSIAQLDAIREEIGKAIGGEGPNRWITITFTADREWAV